ncbi:sporulation integral membrane protein YlbJ [Paenibacillus sp. P96]|uniref:Sporulation integral membrane protein YlbJ n=1 Tax=Paenibacillus zeirhizosphaerae TaxID=2987519 RepID=A0ABT9FUL2_9BACL|nr:sporulation integral membrane protein YlbJ [Paenibacillus sp. P96]MDP4098401.1 sporulation integral membrane protein YlbJ [Paenibacillus sp. P96]
MPVFRQWSVVLFSASLFITCVLMALHPLATLDAGVRGLAIWWDVLFPSLFPFFVISELLLGFGIVHGIGALLDPLMKPLFRVPGCGGFVAAISCASGYPIGAKLTAKLWQQKLLTREEGERLVAFTTSSDPIFLIGAVSVGFFHTPSIAIVIVLSHYLGALLVGLLMRFHAPHASGTSGPAEHGQAGWREALQTMHKARLEDGRPFGEMLLDSVRSSLRLIIVVGGLVVFFSVLLESLNQSGLMQWLYNMAEVLLTNAGIPTVLSDALVGGIFEVTLGVSSAGAATDVPLAYKAAAAVFVLSWGGLSVHAQIASILNDTNLRYPPFLLARAVHAIVSPCLLLLLWKPLMGGTDTVQVFQSIWSVPLNPVSGFIAYTPLSLIIALSVLVLLALLRLFFKLLQRPE